jgi:hypothetical protein
MKSMLKSAWHTARCDDSTALGLLLAPEVNKQQRRVVGLQSLTARVLARRRDTGRRIPDSPGRSVGGRASATTTWQPSADQVIAAAACSGHVAEQHARLDGSAMAARSSAHAVPKLLSRRRHRTDERRGDKGHRPFGPVAHRDGDAVAGRTAAFSLQAAGQGIDGSEEAVEAPALALVGHELLGPMGARRR